MNNHTSNLIKSNIATILTEFPSAHIRPCNKYEANGAKPAHTREQHHFAHICVTPFTTETNQDGTQWRRYENERFFYITSSTTDWIEHDTAKCISFRKELLDEWNLHGYCDIIWFIKNTNKYMIISAKDLAQNYVDAITNKQLKQYDVEGRMYCAFPVAGEVKTRASECPKYTAFDIKYINTFDYIENVVYTNRRNYNGTVYAVAWVPSENGKKTVIKEYISIKQAFDLTQGFSSDSYRTCVRRTQAGVAQKLIPLYDDYVVYFTYDKSELDDLEALYERLTKKVKKHICVLDEKVTVEKTETKEVEEVITNDVELNALDDLAAESEYDVDLDTSEEIWDKSTVIKEVLQDTEIQSMIDEFRKKCDLRYIREQEYENAKSLF